jgi:hypothetical protein
MRARIALALALFEASRVTMYSLPFAAQSRKIGAQNRFNTVELRQTEPIILPQFRRSVRTMQIENGLATVTDHVYVRRPVIIWVDHDTQSANAENRRHRPTRMLP